MFGDCTKNKWCCFCKHWYDPTNKALTPKTGRNLFDIDNKMKSKCILRNLQTISWSTCQKFERKM